MALDPVLLNVLACPRDKGPLWYFPSKEILYNERLRLSYRVIETIPNLLPDEATHLQESEHDALMAETKDAVRTGSPQ